MLTHSLFCINNIYESLEQVRIFVLTDGIAKSKNFKPRDVGSKTIPARGYGY